MEGWKNHMYCIQPLYTMNYVLYKNTKENSKGLEVVLKSYVFFRNFV